MISQNLTSGETLHQFTIERIQDIPELRTQAALFTHEKTGAHLLHLFNENPNNLFCIGFRTPVYNNTGVPHILEHSVLAGSKKFPLKDPFKEMLKGSLQTFLNAITYPDKTIYPVSSQVEKDYFNLVDVYCDAVFNPLLSEMTFAQEGWHFDLEKPDGPVSIKGIVYNEMKGVFSDFRSHVSRKTLSELFPDTTYYYESGGEPEHITDLTWDEFKKFHEQYYHPSNAFIVLYGNIPSEKTLAFLQKTYLYAFNHREVTSEVTPQPKWTEPRKISFSAPATKEDDGTASVILSWVLDSSKDPLNALLGRIFSHYLFSNESSPLRRVLIDSKLGEDLDDMCGFDGDFVQGIFCAGLRKTNPDKAEEIRKLIYGCIVNEVEKGLDAELLEGSIRQIEFRLREITDGAHFPYHLSLAERAYRSWMYGGDPLAHLCFEEPLLKIKEKKRAGTTFFVGKMKELLLDNSHNLLTTVKASSEIGEMLGKKTVEQAAALSSSFTDEDKKKYYTLTQELLEEQKRPPSAEALATLPKLNKHDLPPENEKVPTNLIPIADLPVYTHPLFTAGIIYLDIGFDLTVIPLELVPYFSLYAELITRCGAAGKTPEEMAKRISLSTGGIGSSEFCATRFGTDDDLVFKCFFHGKALPERLEEMIAIFTDLFNEPEIDNHKQLRDILFEMRNDLNGAILRSGHTFAVANAASRISKSRYIDETLDGVSQLRFLNGLIQRDDMDVIAEAMKQLHEIVINRKNCVISSTYDKPEEITGLIGQLIGVLPSSKPKVSNIDFTEGSDEKPRGIEISSSVNYVARSWGLEKYSPSAMGELFLLSRNLSTGYLWDKVRVEGGAYGGMAMISGLHPVFSCASYRDPNLTDTLNNFTSGLESVKNGLSREEVDQNIIGAIGRMDQPHGPHAKGYNETVAILCGRTQKIRQQIREAVMNSTPKSLSQQAEKILTSGKSAVTVFGSIDAFNIAEKSGGVFERESLLNNEEK